MSSHVHHTVLTPLGDVLLTCEVAGFEPWPHLACFPGRHPVIREVELAGRSQG